MTRSIGLPPEVGLQRILSLLEAEDADVRIHAVKVVANLAAEGFFPQFSPFDLFFLLLPLPLPFQGLTVCYM